MEKLLCTIGEYGVIVNSKQEILILKLRITSEFQNGAWMLPGGRVEENEQACDALKREVFEETGLTVEVIRPVHTAIWGDDELPKYSVFFLCRTAGAENILLSNEHIDSAWIKLDEVENIPWRNSNSKIAIAKSFEEKL